MEITKNEARTLIEHYAGLITSGIPGVCLRKMLQRMQELNQLVEIQEPVPALIDLPCDKQEAFQLSFVLGMLENLREGTHEYLTGNLPFSITKTHLPWDYAKRKLAGKRKKGTGLAAMLETSLQIVTEKQNLDRR